MKYKNVIFTAWKRPQYDDFINEIVWCNWQPEITKGGRIHYQGTCLFTNKVFKKDIRRIFSDPTIHFEEVASDERATAYVNKVRSRIIDIDDVFNLGEYKA